MTDRKLNELQKEFDDLEQTMVDADQFRTLEEQVAEMKRRGIDPSEAYKRWEDEKDDDEDDDDWGDERWKENGKWERKTPEDLDEKARENWDGDSGKTNPPPIV